jgi:hypothetical protein
MFNGGLISAVFLSKRMKEMKNTEILSGVLIDWGKPMIDDIANSLVGERLNTANAWIRKYFPVSESYSLWNDLSFLAMPIVNMSITPMLDNGLTKLGLTDADVPKYANEVVDAMLEEAEKKGTVKLLERYNLTADDLRRLKKLLNENLKIE